MLLIFFWYIIKYKKVIDTKYDCIQGNEIKFWLLFTRYETTQIAEIISIDLNRI